MEEAQQSDFGIAINAKCTNSTKSYCRSKCSTSNMESISKL